MHGKLREKLHGAEAWWGTVKQCVLKRKVIFEGSGQLWAIWYPFSGQWPDNLLKFFFVTKACVGSGKLKILCT